VRKVLDWSMLGFGALGAVVFALGATIAWKVAHSPGDDNPAALMGIAAAMLALVPGYGVVLHLRREPIRRHLVWLVLASVTSVPLGLVLPILWMLAW
jgi:hypothetical protein